MNAYDHVEKASELKNEANALIDGMLDKLPDGEPVSVMQWNFAVSYRKQLLRLLEITTEIDRLVEQTYLDANIEGHREGEEEARRECEDNHGSRRRIHAG